MKHVASDHHEIESALARLSGFVGIVEMDARNHLTDPDGLLESARSAVETLRKACEPLLTSGPTATKQPRRIFLQFAMKVEAKPLIEALEAQPVQFEWATRFPFEFFFAIHRDFQIYIGVAGMDPVHQVDSIGSVPAAVLAQMAVNHLHPSLVVNPGTCGGFQSRGHSIAEVFVGTSYVAFHHRRSSIPIMREYGIGKYPVCNSTALRTNLKLPGGIVSSGDALDYSKEDQEYMESNGSTLKEMEAAAIGWVCQLTRVSFLPIKTVTDWVDHPACTASQFKANYVHAIEQLTAEVIRVLEYLASHPEDSIWR